MTRLPTAIGRLAAAGQAQVERVHALRGELAEAERNAFEASHRMTLEAMRLRRAARPRVVMPVDAGQARATVHPAPWPTRPLDWSKLRGIVVLA